MSFRYQLNVWWAAVPLTCAWTVLLFFIPPRVICPPRGADHPPLIVQTLINVSWSKVYPSFTSSFAWSNLRAKQKRSVFQLKLQSDDSMWVRLAKTEKPANCRGNHPVTFSGSCCCHISRLYRQSSVITQQGNLNWGHFYTRCATLMSSVDFLCEAEKSMDGRLDTSQVWMYSWSWL